MNKIVFGITLAIMALLVSATAGQAVSASLCCDNWSVRGGDHDNHGDCGDNSDCSGGSSNAYNTQPTIKTVSYCGWDPQSPQCN